MSAAALSQKSANIETASASDSWATPPELFAALSVLYGPFASPPRGRSGPV
jgi:hypothetical protein